MSNVTSCNNGVNTFWIFNVVEIEQKTMYICFRSFYRLEYLLFSRFQFHTIYIAFCWVEYVVAIMELHFHKFYMIRKCDVGNDYLKGISIRFCSNKSVVKRFCEYCSMNTRSFKDCFARYLFCLKLSYSKLKMQITFW